MKFKDYNFSIKIQEITIDPPPNLFAFQIQDSIHSLYPEGTIMLNDDTSALTEHNLFAVGSDCNILFYTDRSNSHIVGNYEIKNAAYTQLGRTIAGTISSMIRSEIRFKETILPKNTGVYKGTIPQIIKRISPHQTNLQNFQGNFTFYGLGDSEKKMYRRLKNLIKGVTPTFLYINHYGILSLENYQRIWNREPSINLHYTTSPHENEYMEYIQEGKFITNNKNIANKKEITSFDLKKGEHIKSTISNSFKNIPFLNTDNDIMYIGESIHTYNHDIIKNEQNQIYFPDKKTVKTTFNPDLCSGKTVDLKFHSYGENGKIVSLRHSGKYIIEVCTHIWDADEAFTRLLVSRPVIPIPNTQVTKT